MVLTLGVTWRTERWTERREAAAARRQIIATRVEDATNTLAAINSLTWEVTSTPAPVLLEGTRLQQLRPNGRLFVLLYSGQWSSTETTRYRKPP